MFRPNLRSALSCFTNPFLGLPRKLSNSFSRTEEASSVLAEKTHLRSLPDSTKNRAPSLEKHVDKRVDMFDEMKQRFLNFKKHVYMEELERYNRLAKVQTPKFMVIACADSRVCPSNVLGLRPGEAFTTRNIANFVPPLQNGPSETNAALEFAVNTLEVENILVIGHSRCGGIETLMTMHDDLKSSLVQKWVVKAEAAKIRTRLASRNESFDEQCRHCEKESVNTSLLNLLTYPWIEEKVKRKQLSIHGGYYDFLNCTFEKWTLDFKSSCVAGQDQYLVKDQAFWC